MKDIKYTINGESYSSLDEIPPEERKLLGPDSDKNGVPDILDEAYRELDMGKGGRAVKNSVLKERITINGKDYNSWDEVPAQYRKFEEQVRARQSKEGATITSSDATSIIIPEPSFLSRLATDHRRLLIGIGLLIIFVFSLTNNSRFDRYTFANIRCTISGFYDEVIKNSPAGETKQACLLKVAASVSQNNKDSAYDLCLRAAYDKEGCSNLYGGNWQNLSAGECVAYLPTDNQVANTVWRDKLSVLFPERKIYNVGSLCALRDGKKILTYTALLPGSQVQKSLTSVLFIKEDVVENEIDLNCKPAGDIPTPIIESINEASAQVYCRDFDAGEMYEERFIIDLNSSQLINRESMRADSH